MNANKQPSRIVFSEMTQAELKSPVQVFDPDSGESRLIPKQEVLKTYISELGAVAVEITMNGHLSKESNEHNAALTRSIRAGSVSRVSDQYRFSVVGVFEPETTLRDLAERPDEWDQLDDFLQQLEDDQQQNSQASQS